MNFQGFMTIIQTNNHCRVDEIRRDKIIMTIFKYLIQCNVIDDLVVSIRCDALTVKSIFCAP